MSCSASRLLCVVETSVSLPLPSRLYGITSAWPDQILEVGKLRVLLWDFIHSICEMRPLTAADFYSAVDVISTADTPLFDSSHIPLHQFLPQTKASLRCASNLVQRLQARAPVVQLSRLYWHENLLAQAHLSFCWSPFQNASFFGKK